MPEDQNPAPNHKYKQARLGSLQRASKLIARDDPKSRLMFVEANKRQLQELVLPEPGEELDDSELDEAAREAAIARERERRRSRSAG